jgi:hypothetical protein
MATQPQIEANKRNAQLSKGPVSAPGKERSSRNSWKHGLAAEVLVADDQAEEFEARLAEWEAEVRPATAEAHQALRRAVAMTFRLDRCLDAYEAARVDHIARARLAWDEDRAAEAGALIGRISGRPEVVASALRTTAHGVDALLGAWGRLAAALEADGGEWTEDEVDAACDLLGIPSDLRRGRLPFDPERAGADAGEVRAARRTFVAAEVERLREAREDRLGPLGELRRSQAEAGVSALLAPAVRTILRYERAADRLYQSSLRAARSPSKAESATEPASLQAPSLPAFGIAVGPLPLPSDEWPPAKVEFDAVMDDIEARPLAARRGPSRATPRPPPPTPAPSTRWASPPATRRPPPRPRRRDPPRTAAPAAAMARSR